MKIWANTVVTVVISLMVTLIFTFTVNYFTQPKGTVSISPELEIGREFYVPIDITNYSNDLINGVIFSVPASTDIQGIVSSSPIKLEALPASIGTGQRKNVTLSGIEPTQITKLLVPVATSADSTLVQILNANQLGLTNAPVQDLKSPLTRTFELSIPNVLLYIIFYGVFSFWLQARLNQAKEDVRQARNEINSLRDETKKEMQVENEKFVELGKQFVTMRLMLLAKLSDYVKELDFWRDTVRKLLYQTTHEQVTAEKLIDQVTDSLKTYHTREKEFDVDVAIRVGELLSKSNVPDKVSK